MSADTENKLVKVEIDATTRIEQEGELLEIGKWYWFSDTDREWLTPDDADYDPTKAKKKGEGYYEYEDVEWLGCVVLIGSNVVEIERAGSDYSSTVRIHLDDVHKRLRYEPNHKSIIETEVRESKERVSDLMKEVKELTNRLGVSPRLGLPEPQTDQSYALATLSGTDNIESYETSLVRAKDKELPALFEQIKNENNHLATWMKAETIPLMALAKSMKGVIGEIDDRIFNVSLYAGLTETVCKVRDGEPAGYDEKLHLMQRKLYMDEECLVGYRTGGMDFDSIGQFDEWLCEEENFERIFAYPRCMVAFQVRRGSKKRAWGGSPVQTFINVRLAEQDQSTFLYIRNGEQLFWLECNLDFGGMIFPDQKEFKLNQPQMVSTGFYDKGKLISVGDYEERCKEEAKRQKAVRKWNKANPLKKWKAAKQAEDERKNWPWYKDEWERENPHYEYRPFRPDQWAEFNQTYLYYDEEMQKITKQVKYYNRISLIIQGLFDRSEVMHPHPPYKTWTPEGFMEAIKLVYDGTGVLYAGDPPSFREYVAKCNALADENSVFIGQEEIWEQKEAVKENARKARSWRRSDYDRDVEFYRPHGNPGPGFMSHVAKWQKRAKKAVFVWNRKRQTSSRYGSKRYGDPMRTTISVPLDDLFNVSAYKPGDFKQFFADPRTRRKYLQWAPALLTAEEYHAGNLKPQEPTE